MVESNIDPNKKLDERTLMDGAAERLEKVYSTAARLAKSAPGHEARAFEHAIEVLTGIDPRVATRMRPALPVAATEEAEPKRPRSAASPRSSGPRGGPSTRIKPLLEAEPKRFNKYVEELKTLTNKHKLQGLLRLARDEFQVNELSVGDLYHLVAKLRLGIQNNVVRDALSKMDFSEVGFRDSDEGRLYSLNLKGEEALSEAIGQAKKGEKGQERNS